MGRWFSAGFAGLVVILACTGGESTASTASGADTSGSQGSTSVATLTSSGGLTTGATTRATLTGTASSGFECGRDRDCERGFICIDGRCEFDPGHCGYAVVELEIPRKNVVLIVDKSASMIQATWDHDADPDTPPVTRWSSLVRAIEHLAGTYERSLNFGLVAFPGFNATSELSLEACPVAPVPQVPVSTMNAAALLSVLPGADAGADVIAGATPTRAAIETATDHLATLKDQLDHINVLFTDGAANCDPDAVDEAALLEVYDDGVINATSGALGQGVRTFVVGVDVNPGITPMVVDGEPDGIDVPETLNELALAGGTALHNADNEAELLAAVEAIAASLLPCTIIAAEPLSPPCQVDVILGETTYPGPAASCEGVDGWRYTGEGYADLELCGQACAEYRELGAVDVRYDFCC